MARPRQSVLQTCSRVLLWLEAAIFLLGEAFLYEIRHVNLFVSAAIGILGGLLVILLGAAIGIAGESGHSEQHFD